MEQGKEKSQASNLVAALISSSFDQNPDTQRVMIDSLSQYGKKQPELVLVAIRDFLQSHTKIDQTHRLQLLTCINNIISSYDDIKLESAKKIISLASEDLTNTKKLSRDCQHAASVILVTLGKTFLVEVMEELQKKFVTGIAAHHYVMQTFGQLSLANVPGVMKYIGYILNTTVSQIGTVKSDTLRVCFATSIANFCEAISEYCSNPQASSDFDHSAFSNEFKGAFDVLFTVWLQSRNIKVQLATAEALGKLILLMPLNDMEERAAKLVSALILQYKKHLQNPLPITSSLCDVITAVTQKYSHVIEGILDSLIVTLHGQVGNTPDVPSQDMVKNYNEVLRCFGILATCYADSIVAMVLLRADYRDEKIRAGNLVIIRHLINTNSDGMSASQDTIISGFQKCLNETSNHCKQNLAKLVTAMGTRGYLLREGGHYYVRFVVQQCSLADVTPLTPANQKINQTVSNEEIRAMCDDILLLLTTTVPDAEKVLWPYLFDFVANVSYMNGFGVVVRSLAILAKNKKKESDTECIIDFEHVVNIPRPVALLARFFVMLAYPHQPRMHPDQMLSLIQDLAPSFHEKLPELMDKEVPKVLEYLSKNTSSDGVWSQHEWEELVLKLLSDVLDVVADEEWSSTLGQSLTAQWPLYDLYPEYKNFAFKCLGVVLQKIVRKEFVESYLSLVFMTVQHANPMERQGAAACVGRCASAHLDTTIEKLKEYVNVNITKKESSYFNVFKSERSLIELENHKGTAALCCGYIALHTPADLLVSRLETNLIKIITSLFKGLKNNLVKVDLVGAIHLIAMSLNSPHFISLQRQPKYVFAAREDLISRLLAYYKDDDPTKPNNLKLSILTTCTSLVKLDPALSPQDMDNMVKVSLNHTLPLSVTSDAGKALAVRCTDAMNNLFEEVMKKHRNSTGFQAIFKHLEPFLKSESHQERARALLLTKALLEMFYRLILLSETHNALSKMGLLIASVLPCCCDADSNVRVEAFVCLRQLLCILYKSDDPSSSENNSKLASLEEVGAKLVIDDEQTMYEAIIELTKVMCIKLPSDLTQFIPGSLTMCLMDALIVPQKPSANGACLALKHIFDTRGSTFADKVEPILACLLDKLTELYKEEKPSHVRDGVLQLVCLLTSHHLHASVNSLLSTPLPFNEVILSCWSHLAVDRVGEPILEFLLEHMDRILPYEEVLKKKGKPQKGSTKYTAISSLSTSCALHAVLKSLAQHRNKENEAIAKNSHRIIAMALVRVGAMFDVQSPHKLEVDGHRQAIELLKSAVDFCCARKVKVMLVQAKAWESLEAREDLQGFAATISMFVSALCLHQAGDIAHIVSSLNNYLASPYDLQRLTAIAFFAQLVKEKSGRNEVLIEIIMNSLRNRLVDKHRYVRQLCIEGLANIVYASHDQIGRYSTSVLSAMMSGMDDNDDPHHSITLAAMSGLAKFLNEVEKVNIHSIFINICLRARPCFEKVDARVRAAAFLLFGALARFASSDLETSFNEQIHSNLVSILLHLNDDDEEVRRSCKITLKKVGSNVGSDEINEIFQKHLPDSSTLHYGEFMNNLAKNLAVHFPSKINFYVMDCISFYRSEWVTIRCNAAMFCGFLLHNLSDEVRENINKEHACAALIQLLKDHSSEVRCKAAEAISLLHQY